MASQLRKFFSFYIGNRHQSWLGKAISQLYLFRLGHLPCSWCCTTDPTTRWEFCDIPLCEVTLNSTVPQNSTACEENCIGDDCPSCPENVAPRRTCGTKSKSQSDYRGDISWSESGHQCDMWIRNAGAQALGFTPESFPWDGLFGSFCRNPNNEREKAWCFVGNTTWEYCQVPDCKECGTSLLKYEDYRGTEFKTKNGKTCLKWVDREEQLLQSNFSADYFYLEENYCRNINGAKDSAWCYIEGGDPFDWDVCEVPSCHDEQLNEPALCAPTSPDCGYLSHRQVDYRGPINVTVSGRTCQSWNSQVPHEHKCSDEGHGDNNYCRNHGGDSHSQGAWCYTTDPDVIWEYCPVPDCAIKDPRYDCGSMVLKQKEYRGSVNVTSGGIPCQPWNSQNPHNHKFTPENYFSAGLEEAFCRNPDGSERAWCYTSDPHKLWDYCDVPAC